MIFLQNDIHYNGSVIVLFSRFSTLNLKLIPKNHIRITNLMNLKVCNFINIVF
jgi:hypothetical protein